MSLKLMTPLVSPKFWRPNKSLSIEESPRYYFEGFFGYDGHVVHLG